MNVAEKAMIEQQDRQPYKVTARDIKQEVGIQCLENENDVVERNSPDVGSHAKRPYCTTVVSSSHRLGVVRKKDRIIIYLLFHAIVVNAMQPSCNNRNTTVSVHDIEAETPLSKGLNPQRTN